jgi:hypothetical protein
MVNLTLSREIESELFFDSTNNRYFSEILTQMRRSILDEIPIESRQINLSWRWWVDNPLTGGTEIPTFDAVRRELTSIRYCSSVRIEITASDERGRERRSASFSERSVVISMDGNRYEFLIDTTKRPIVVGSSSRISGLFADLIRPYYSPDGRNRIIQAGSPTCIRGLRGTDCQLFLIGGYWISNPLISTVDGLEAFYSVFEDWSRVLKTEINLDAGEVRSDVPAPWERGANALARRCTDLLVDSLFPTAMRQAFGTPRNILIPKKESIPATSEQIENKRRLVSCIYNARSPYLKCAVNPTEECRSCSHYEAK